MTTMKRAVAPIVCGGIIAIVLILYMVTFQVRYIEVAIVLTWKSPAEQPVTEPGLYWKLPWPIQEVKRFDKRIRTYERRTFQTQTKDGKPVAITPYVNWRIKPGRTRDFLVKLGSVKDAENKLASRLSNACSVRLGGTNLSDLLNTEKQGEFAKLEENIRTSLTEGMDDTTDQELGIEVVSVGLKRLVLDEKVTTAAFRAMVQERQKEVQESISEGQGQAAAIRVAADITARSILAAAEAEAGRTRADGIQEAARYYPVFAQNEELHDFLNKMEALRSTLAKRTTILMDKSWDLIELLAHQPTVRPRTPAGPGAQAPAETEAPASPKQGGL